MACKLRLWTVGRSKVIDGWDCILAGGRPPLAHARHGAQESGARFATWLITLPISLQRELSQNDARAEPQSRGSSRESIMKRLIPDWAVGVMAGFVIGCLAGMSLHVFGLNPHGLGAVIGGAVG